MAFPLLTEWFVNNIFALIPLRKIHSYEKGVKFRGGKDIKELSYGIYLYIPYYESIEIVDIQEQTHNLVSQSMTSLDMLPITFSCNLTYKVKNARLMFTAVHNFDQSLESRVMMVVADEASKMKFSTLVDNRNKVENKVRTRLNRQVKDWGTVINDFAFTDLVTARQYRFFGDLPTL